MKKDFYHESVFIYDDINIEYQRNFRTYLIKIYNYMALGPSLTGTVAFLVTLMPSIVKIVLASPLT
jgi:FtsH-binding integral membrane protein